MSAEQHPEVTAMAIAARQHGIITTSQAIGAGLTHRQVERLAGSGRWIRIGRGVHRIAGAPHTWYAEVLAACLAADAIASHRTAAVLHGLPGFGPGTPEISVPRGRHSRWGGVRVHESGDIDLASPRTVIGIPTTGVARTLVDIGAVARWPVVEEATFQAIDRRLVTWDSVATTLVQHATPGRAGVGTMRRVIEHNNGRPVPQSRLELLALRLMESHGLPVPDRQIPIFDEDGFVARVDAGFLNARVLIELDGRSVHARRLAFEADAEKRNRIKLAGYELLVFTWRMIVRRPQMVICHVERALANSPGPRSCTGNPP